MTGTKFKNGLRKEVKAIIKEVAPDKETQLPHTKQTLNKACFIFIISET